MADNVAKVPKCLATNLSQKDETSDDRRSMCPQARYEAQHPTIFSYPQAGPADYPIFQGLSGLGPIGACPEKSVPFVFQHSA